MAFYSGLVVEILMRMADPCVPYWRGDLMKMRVLQTVGIIALGLACSGPPTVLGWGDEGHRLVNRAAVEKLPGDMPAFFRNASARLALLGPEPDRWRDS